MDRWSLAYCIMHPDPTFDLRSNDAPNVVVHQQTSLVSGAHEVTLFVHDSGARWVIVDGFADVIGKTVDEDVAELVTTCDSLIINHLGGGDPPGLRVIGKHKELSRRDSFVGDEESRLLDISYYKPRTLYVQGEMKTESM
jgi:hypothetical protein